MASGTFVERELYQSKAFISLSGAAPQVLINFLGKRKFQKHKIKNQKKYVCGNGDSIHFTYIEAQKSLGITQPRFTRAIDELLAKGFISVVKPGGSGENDKAIYAMVEKWLLWKPGEVIEKRQKYLASKGFCKPKRI